MNSVAENLPAADTELDARGLNCPLPILKTKLALKRMQTGQIIHVTATDPMSKVDFTAYCERTGHELLKMTEDDGVFEFFIRRIDKERRWPEEQTG